MSEEPSGAILIMDDDEAVREAIERILARRGRSVRAVTTAAEARTAVTDPSVALVVADLSAAGPGFSRSIAEIRPDLRVIYVSGRTRSAALRQGLLDADDALISKPFTMSQLRTAVAEALAKGRRGGSR
jgi:DNA-binding NtrC family response regulator